MSIYTNTNKSSWSSVFFYKKTENLGLALKFPAYLHWPFILEMSATQTLSDRRFGNKARFFRFSKMYIRPENKFYAHKTIKMFFCNIVAS